MGSITSYMADVATKKGVVIALNSSVKNFTLSGKTVYN
jgi:phytoene dehydrogenase-like protein